MMDYDSWKLAEPEFITHEEQDCPIIIETGDEEWTFRDKSGNLISVQEAVRIMEREEYNGWELEEAISQAEEE